MYCTNCGNEVPDSAKVCGYCGQHLKVATPRQAAPPASAPTPVEKPVRRAVAPQPEPERTIEPGYIPPTKSEEPSAKKRLPTWGLAVIGLVILTGGAALLFSQGIFSGSTTLGVGTPVQRVALSRACGQEVAARSEAPIEFSYGYWGALEDYFQANYQSMDIQLFVNGERLYGNRNKEILNLSAIPCVDRSNWDDLWWEHSLFMYDTAQFGPLEPGEYQIEVVYYLKSSVRDGWTDDGGNLIVYSPGEVSRLPFTLVVEP